MKFLVPFFAFAPFTLRLDAPVAIANRPAADPDSSRITQRRFLNALLGALSTWSA
jgi:hypothetical protein